MIAILFSWIIISFILFSWGDLLISIYDKIGRRKDHYNYLDCTILGLIAISIPLSIWSLWLPSNYIFLLLSLIIGILSIIINKQKWRKTWNIIKHKIKHLPRSIIFSILFFSLMILISCAWIEGMGDSLYYHHQNIRWNEEYAIVPGLGNLDDKFVRPVRWLVALLDDQVIPVEFATVQSGNVSRGHRFLGESEFVIANPADYVATLEKNFVMVDQNKRREVIKEQLFAIAAEKNADIVWDDDLLEEILYLVEWPTALCGGFEDSYLALPDAAIITPMKDHQRYFPLMSKDGKLLPMFLTVRNGNDKSIEVVQAGNERVLRARLDDAKFFFNEDRKKALIDREEGLTKIVFQEGLGNLADKTKRLLELGRVFGEACELDEDAAVELERATLLAKTDLTTGMVTEFTELQGVMGKEYALLDGESPEVAEAIFEQYLPRFAGDVLPKTDTGKVLSIIDKVDNIVATFSRGLIPTGSQDPYALRRQTIGILNILLESKWNVNLGPIFVAAMNLLNVPADKQAELQGQLEEFFTLRLKNIYLDRQIPHHVIDLLLSNTALSVADAEGLANAVMNNRIDENVELVQAYTRMYNLVKDVTYTGVDESKLVEDAEKALFADATKAAAVSQEAWDNMDYAGVVAVPATLVDSINKFFEDVMVMDKDEVIKANRLQLVRLAYSVIAVIGDVSKLK